MYGNPNIRTQGYLYKYQPYSSILETMKNKTFYIISFHHYVWYPYVKL